MGEKSGLGGADPQDGESVRKRVRRVPDHQDRAVAEGAQDGLEETRFVVGVEARRGFVEEQDARAAEEFAGECETQAFAGREIADGFGQHGVEPARKRADDGIGPGGVERVEKRVVGGRFAASEREVDAERSRWNLHFLLMTGEVNFVITWR